MPKIVISNLPINDTYQFWVSAEDAIGNQIFADMSTTGSVSFPQPVAPTFSNSTHIFTDYTEMATMTEDDMRDVIGRFGYALGERIAPVVVADVETDTPYFTHYVIEMADDTGFTTNVSSKRGEGVWNDTSEVYILNKTIFYCLHGDTYYFRIKVVDQFGNESAWAAYQSETAGDTTAPDEIGSGNVSGSREALVYTVSINSGYTDADDIDYYAWWINTSATHPGGEPHQKSLSREFKFTTARATTYYIFVAAVDKSGNYSANYTTNVNSVTVTSGDLWTDLGNVTNLSSVNIIDVNNRLIKTSDGTTTVIDLTAASGKDAFLDNDWGFAAAGRILLDDHTISFAGTPVVGIEMLARGLKLYESANNYAVLEKTGAGTVNFEVVGGSIKTSGATSYVEMDSTGIKAYNTSTQRVQISSDGSGWLGASDALYWDTSGNLSVDTITADTGSIGGWTIDSARIYTTFDTDKQLNLRVTANQESVYFYDPTPTTGDVGWVGIGTLYDGSSWTAETGIGGVVYNGSGYDKYFWISDVSAEISGWEIMSDRIRKTFDTDHYLTISTASTTECIFFYDSTPGTGDVRWVGIGKLYNGTSWTSEEGIGGVVYNGSGYDKFFWISDQGAEIAGWEFTEELFRSASSGARLEMNATENRFSMFDAVGEKCVMGYLEGLTRNNGTGTATGGSTTYLDDTGQDWQDDEFIGLEIEITSGTGSPQTRTITDNTETRIYAAFSPAVGSGSVYEVHYTSNHYGFWAKAGDTLNIDGDVIYESGDWLIHNDGSLKIIDSNSNEIIRLGTDTGEKGLFIYDTTPTTLAKFISDEIYIGTAGDYLQYTVAGGLVIEGDVTVSGLTSREQPYDWDALLIWPLINSNALDQSGDGNDNDFSTYGNSVTYVAEGVGGGLCASFASPTSSPYYYNCTSPTYDLQEMTICFWAKTNHTAASNRVLDHGSTSTGCIILNGGTNNPLLRLGSSNYRLWVDNAAQDDDEWHHWIFYIAGSAQGDIASSELFIDNTIQTVSSTVSSGSPTTSFTRCILGYDYEGELQDFRIYDRELTSDEKKGVYNNPCTRVSTIIRGNQITTGSIESGNWGASAGSQFDLDAGEFYMGGSSSPKLSWNGTTLAVDGNITSVSGTIGGWILDTNNLSSSASGEKILLSSVNNYMDIHNASSATMMRVGDIGTVMGMRVYDGTGVGESDIVAEYSESGFRVGDVDGDAYIEYSVSDATLEMGKDVTLEFGTYISSNISLFAPHVRLWHETTTPATDNDMGYFTSGGNPYGGDDNNNIITDINPFGVHDLLWECVPTTGDNADGGWAANDWGIDKTKRYRFSIWMKRVGLNHGANYFGCYNNATYTSNLTDDGADSGNGNPYFMSAKDFNIQASTFSYNFIANGNMALRQDQLNRHIMELILEN
ncbi:MAG: LamG-like jellyroll fold domain-containing protein [Candidatus Heimdallarchaeaceae archaeon]|jgi:hypothetical protein